jgi:hypothetical protein
MDRFREQSNYCVECTGNNFADLDEGTQDAIIGDISMLLNITNTDAEDVAKALFYTPYTDGDELRVKYNLPIVLIRKCRY